MGTNNHAIFCFPCGVCLGCVLRHLIVPLQLHLHLHDYIEVVMHCDDSLSSLVRLPCVHRSCGDPRPTSGDLFAQLASPQFWEYQASQRQWTQEQPQGKVRGKELAKNEELLNTRALKAKKT